MLDPDLDKYRKMDPRAIVGTAVDTIAGGVPDHIRTDSLECYDGDRFAEFMRYIRRYHGELPELDAEHFVWEEAPPSTPRRARSHD